MSFIEPFALIFLISIPLILILYLLRQKYMDYTVSSIYLWNEVLRDIEANKPWQRLRKNILMLLQIIAAVLLVFALAKPVFNFGDNGSKTVVMVLDTSLSMQATDYKPTRFEAARKKAVELISSLKKGTRVSIMTFDRDASFDEATSDKNLLINKINSLKVTNVTEDFKGISTILEAYVKSNPNNIIYLFSDKKYSMGNMEINLFDFSKEGENYAITLFSHTTTLNGISALCKVANYSKNDITIPVSLYVDGRAYDAKNVETKANDTVDVYWDNIPLNARTLETRIDMEDYLSEDNSMWNAINQSKENKVLLVGVNNIFIEKALNLVKNIKIYKTENNVKSSLKGYDLYVFDGYVPQELPSDGSSIIFNPSANKFFDVGQDAPAMNIKKSSHQLFNGINDISFNIAAAKKMKLPTWAETVIESENGPLIMAGELENRKLVIAGFDIHKSDMALTPAFPIFMTNCLDWIMPTNIKNIENITPGQAIEFNLNPKAEEASVTIPSGEVFRLAPPFPARVFEDTNEVGLYTLNEKLPGKNLEQLFAVNILSGSESNLQDISKASDINSEESNIITAKASSGFQLQFLLLCGVLFFLLLEWWVYKYEF